MVDMVSVVFERRYYNAKTAKKWLKDRELIPDGRVKKTNNMLIYPLRPPGYNSYFIVNTDSSAVKYIMGRK